MKEKKHTGSTLPGECLLSKVLLAKHGRHRRFHQHPRGCRLLCSAESSRPLWWEVFTARIAKTTRTAQRKILPLQTPRRRSQGITGG